MAKPSLRRLALVLALGWGAAAPAQAAQKTLGTGGASTAFAGQRNVLYIPGKGYWVFFQAANADRVVWRYSPDGQDWKAKDDDGNWVLQADVFPYLKMAPDAAWPNASVWYAPDLNRIYVVSNDAVSDVNGGG